jgi:osmotically inducible lipoprotein OsmB
MNRNMTIGGALAVALVLAGCASMSDTEKRVTTGATLGAAVVGVATGEWAWAAAGAAAGAAGGYLYDQSKKNEQKAYEAGVKDAQGSKAK